MKFTLKITALFLFFSINSLYSQNFESLDSLATRAIEKYNIKGIAMVGVKDGEIVYSKGFGYANEAYTMSEETPLYIASNTKAFIGLAMLKLVNESKIKLDNPITDYIDRKYFPVAIPIEKVSVMDLLSHNTGVSNDPLTFRTSSSGEYPENIQELLIYTEYRSDNTSLEQKFSYSNLGYLLCGIIIENVTGLSWKDYLEKEIFPKLDLKNTHPYLPQGNETDLMAMPYNFKSEFPLKMVKEDNTLHAAGGLFTNLVDMGKWLNFYTSDIAGFEKLKETDFKNYDETLIKFEDSFGPITIDGYGYGWYHGNILEERIIFHAGGFSAHNSFISYLPEKNVGFFVYMNENSNIRLAALQLTFLYYQTVTGNENLKKTFPVFAERVQSAYDTYKSDSLITILPSEKELPIGTFRNDKYGTLKIFKFLDRYEITLGMNLRSKVFEGEIENEILVQFIPEKSVHFTFEGKGNNLKIKYGDDYGYFLRVSND